MTRRIIILLAALPLALSAASAQISNDRLAAKEAMARYEYSKAIELLDRAAEGTSDQSELKEIALQKARCQKNLLRYDAAAETLASVMTPEALDVEVAGELADCHLKSGRLDEALTLYYILTEQHPDNIYLAIQRVSALFKAGSFSSCASLGKKLCQKAPIPSIYSLIGASSLKTGQVDSALVYYRKSYEMNPLNPGTVSSISSILLSRKEYQEVISMAGKFLEAVPDNWEVGQILGVAYYLNDNNDEAYEVFKKLRSSGDQSYGTMYYSGLNAMALNRFTVARECFGSAWQTDSTDAKLAANYATALRKESSSPKTLQEAIRLYDKALELMEPDPGVLFKTHSGLGQIYYSTALYSKALPHYKEALSLKPDYISALIPIAYCYQQKNDLKTALSYYEKYLMLDKGINTKTTFAKQMVSEIKAELHMQE